MTNMVTACWPCNAIKADFTLDQLGWTVQPNTDREWDGLTAYYGQVCEFAGRPDETYHIDWLTLLENATV